MLENLKKKNPDIKIYSVFDEDFRSFGRVITELDADELVRAGEKLEMPESGVKYMAGMDEFESLGGAESIKNEIFGNAADRNRLLLGTQLFPECDRMAYVK